MTAKSNKFDIFKIIKDSVGEKNVRAWERKQQNFIKILSEIQPLEDKIIDSLATKNKIIKDIVQLREQIINHCPHPDEFVIEKNGKKYCKFCEKQFSEYPPQRRVKLQKYNELKRLVEHVNNIENIVLKQLAEKQPLVDKLTEIRNEMIQMCIHPREYVTSIDVFADHAVVRCSFCNKEVFIKLPQENKRGSRDEKNKSKIQDFNILGSQHLQQQEQRKNRRSRRR